MEDNSFDPISFPTLPLLFKERFLEFFDRKGAVKLTRVSNSMKNLVQRRWKRIKSFSLPEGNRQIFSFDYRRRYLNPTFYTIPDELIVMRLYPEILSQVLKFFASHTRDTPADVEFRDCIFDEDATIRLALIPFKKMEFNKCCFRVDFPEVLESLNVQEELHIDAERLPVPWDLGKLLCEKPWSTPLKVFYIWGVNGELNMNSMHTFQDIFMDLGTYEILIGFKKSIPVEKRLLICKKMNYQNRKKMSTIYYWHKHTDEIDFPYC